MTANNNTLKFTLLGIAVVIVIVSAGCLWLTTSQQPVSSTLNQSPGEDITIPDQSPESSVEFIHSGGGLNLTSSHDLAIGSHVSASLPVVRGSPYIFSDIFPADLTVREVRLWIVSDASVFTLIAPVHGGTTISEKTLRFIFDENQTALLHTGNAYIILEQPGDDKQYALSLNQKTGYITLHENGSESVVFNRNEIPRNQSGADAAGALSQAITRANPRFPARETTLTVEDPYIRIENPGNLPAGYPFSIHGTTNLGDGDEIIILVASTYTKPCKTARCHRLNLTQTIRVDGWPGTVKNWMFDDRTSVTFTPDEYFVEATAPRTGAKTALLFNITPLVITIDPVSSQMIHDSFSVTGTTNIPAGETIFVEISDTSFFGPCNLHPQCNVSSASGPTSVVAGMKNGQNTWNFSCDISSFDNSDEYLVFAHSFDTVVYSDLFRLTR